MLVSALQWRQSSWLKSKSQSSLSRSQHGIGMLFEQNILGQPQRGETQAVPAVFHLTCAQQAPSLGTAVGRGWQRTTVPPGQAPLVGLEQGVTQGQNHMYHLSSCKPTNYPCRKKQTGKKKKKTINQNKLTKKPITTWQVTWEETWVQWQVRRRQEQVASGYDCAPVASGWRVHCLGKNLCMFASHTLLYLSSGYWITTLNTDSMHTQRWKELFCYCMQTAMKECTN